MTSPKIEYSNKTISTRLRLGTMLLDHALICLVGIPPLVIWHQLTQQGVSITPISPYLMMPLFVIYFCKDCISGRSASKRILKLAVVNNKTGIPATPLQCLIRNLFIIIWPVEVVVAAFNHQRRLGDLLAGTKLTYYQDKNNFSIKSNQIAFAIIIATGLTYLLIKLFDTI